MTGIARHSAVGLGGWLVVAACMLELVTREVVRRSATEAVFGLRPGLFTLVALAAVGGALAFWSRPADRRAPPWHRGTPILFAVIFTLGVACQIALGARLQSDGFYYYAYLRSLVFDGDVEFSNDYRLLGLGDKPHLFKPTPTGYAQSAWTIGPAIVWAPFFAAGHLVARELNKAGAPVSTDGVSYPYRQAVCIAGLVYGLLGCWFAFRLTSRLAPQILAAGAVAATVSGSFMLWYLVKEPSMTHAPSMALVSGFALAWFVTRERRTTAQWVLLGLLAGFMTLVRWQNALFAILPASDAAVALATSWRNADRARAVRTIAAGLLFTAAASVAFVPQMLAWKAIYGSYLAVSPVGPQIRFADPQIVDILFSSRNGLLSTSPVLYVGAIGLVLFTVSKPGAGVPLLLAVGLMTWFNASIQDWWGSAGFGGRRFDGTIPMFCIGLAVAAERAVALVRRRPAEVVAAAGVALVLWNVALLSTAQRGVMRIGESASFGDLGAEQTRTLHRWLGHPFTYPTSLLFALRNGVSPAHYDMLSANRFLSDPLRPYGRLDIGSGDDWSLGIGWYPPEREGPATFRWAGQQAWILIPLDHRAPLRTQIQLHALGYPHAPAQTLTLSVNGHAHPAVTVSPEWQTLEWHVPADRWRAGVNRLELTFAWAQAPAHVGLGGDPRPLSAAVDFVRVQVVE
jgi:hypothetical protein